MTENLLRGGDYVPDGFGGFVRLQEEEALLERALFKLTCRRGAFPFLPELGSRLRELGRLRPSARNAAAQQYAAQALEGWAWRSRAPGCGWSLTIRRTWPSSWSMTERRERWR